MKKKILMLFVFICILVIIGIKAIGCGSKQKGLTYDLTHEIIKTMSVEDQKAFKEQMKENVRMVKRLNDPEADYDEIVQEFKTEYEKISKDWSWKKVKKGNLLDASKAFYLTLMDCYLGSNEDIYVDCKLKIDDYGKELSTAFTNSWEMQKALRIPEQRVKEIYDMGKKKSEPADQSEEMAETETPVESEQKAESK